MFVSVECSNGVRYFVNPNAIAYMYHDVEDGNTAIVMANGDVLRTEASPVSINAYINNRNYDKFHSVPK